MLMRASVSARRLQGWRVHLVFAVLVIFVSYAFGVKAVLRHRNIFQNPTGTPNFTNLILCLKANGGKACFDVWAKGTGVVATTAACQTTGGAMCAAEIPLVSAKYPAAALAAAQALAAVQPASPAPPAASLAPTAAPAAPVARAAAPATAGAQAAPAVAGGGAAAPNIPLCKKAAAESPARGPTITLTEAHLKACFLNPDEAKVKQALPYLQQALVCAQITTCPRVATFLAQVGHESGDLKYMEELATGKEYEGRKDLGNTAPGDGEKYKGRGPIQLTGKANYEAASKDLGVNVAAHPEEVKTNKLGFLTTAWFWVKNGLNKIADSLNIREATKVINGGTNGAADREKRFAQCRKSLGC